MKSITSIFGPLPLGLLLPGLVAILATLEPQAEEKLVFRSVAERSLEKHFVQHSSMDLVEMKVTLEGPEGPQEPEIELPKLKIVDDETIEFTDETLAAGEGRPKKLKRTFDSIENSVTFESEGSEDEEGGSETTKNVTGLTGKSVLFTWNDEEEAFEAAWPEGESGDDDLLEDLVEDADFRGWLPQGAVSEGDTWKIPGAEFNNLQEPSGPMGYRAEGEEEARDDSESDELRDNIEGEIEATFKGTRDEAGIQVGVIAFEAKLSSKSQREVENDEGPAGESTTESAMDLQGEILWDLAGGHFRALKCDSDYKFTSAQKRTLEFDQGTLTITERRGFEGKKTYRFTCAPKK